MSNLAGLVSLLKKERYRLTLVLRIDSDFALAGTPGSRPESAKAFHGRLGKGTLAK